MFLYFARYTAEALVIVEVENKASFDCLPFL